MNTALPGRTRRLHPGLTLAAVCVAVLVLPASLTGTSVALPSIGQDLNAGLVPLQWVVNAYNLTFASFMLAAGSLADLFGRRRVFTIGTVVFALSSLASGLANNVILLDLARAAAGIGAAAVMTAGCAILANTFQGPAIAKAFGLLGASAGAGLALGPSTSGLLVGSFGWRAVFLSHLVIGVLVLLAVPFLGESRDAGATGVDWPGTVTFSSSLFLLTLAVVQGPQLGWASGTVLALLAGFAVLMVAFVVAELRQRRPMFDLGLFRNSRFVAACLLPVAAAFGFVSLLVFLPSYFVGADGATSEGAGTAMLALTLPVLAVPVIAGRLVARGIQVRVVLSLSLLLIAVGAAWLTIIQPGIGLPSLVGPLLVIGVGMGLSAGLIDGVAISSVEPERAGMAACMFNTMRLASEAIAIAGIGSVLVTLVQDRLSDGIDRFPAASGDVGGLANKVVGGDVAGQTSAAGGADNAAFGRFLADGYTDALHTVLWVVAAICAVGAAIVFVILADRNSATQAAGAVETEEFEAAGSQS
jgi:MFS family permease